jgi:hypothetical protein
MMVLFLDVNSSMIVLYGEEGVVRIPFQNAGQLYDHMESNEVLYITNAVQTTGQEVVNMIKGMGVSVHDVKSEKPSYIHVAEDGVIPIDEYLRFRGKYDVHPLDDAFIKKIKETPLLQTLIKTGKLELITSSRRKELAEEYNRKEDEKLGGILVDGTVDEFFDSSKKQGPSDVIVVEIDGGGSAVEGGRIDTMSELMSKIEGLG